MSFGLEIDGTHGANARANRIDTYRFPLVEVWMGDSGVDELRTHLREMNEVLTRGRAGIVYDVRDANVLNPAERQIYMDYFNWRREFVTEHCACLGLVLDSPLKRGVLTAIQWAIAIPFPVRIFAKKPDAEAWVRSTLASS